MTEFIHNWDKTKVQGILSIASFACGVIIASVCLFIVPPYGEIASSTISISRRTKERMRLLRNEGIKIGNEVDGLVYQLCYDLDLISKDDFF